MAAKFKIGLKVQAVDELGRWADGKVVHEEGLAVEVKFTGWPEKFNRTFVVPCDELREPVLPAEQQMRSKWTIIYIFQLFQQLLMVEVSAI